jgi:hypothetical protein
MILETIISDHVIYAIGWVILHSLWQGAILSIVYGIISLYSQKLRSEIRYAVGIAALMSMGIISLITFFQTWNGYTISQTMVNRGMALHMSAQLVVNSSETFLQIAFRYFNENLPFVVLIWFLGVMILTVRFMGGFLYCRRIRVHQGGNTCQWGNTCQLDNMLR